ncbi:MAG: M20/M25/M40 family metallo-hydrolase [Bacillota bacterium]|nr:M20/M25/M40 family metallo-hydrolase [Bacillota bacterium]
MLDLLKRLSLARGVSGDEGGIRKLITFELKPYVTDIYVDNLGNLIAYKKGMDSSKKVMAAAHMDEVGLVVKHITDEGFLRCMPMGGIDPRVVLGRRVLIGERGVPGVIGTKAVHQQNKDERSEAPDFKKLLVDIGAKNREDALKKVALADTAVFDSDFILFGDGFVKGKALDNRCGCLALIEAAKKTALYDTYFVFTVEEEVGTKGANTSAYKIEPDIAIVVDTTTAADFEGVDEARRASKLGSGAVIFFIESTTVYDPHSVNKARGIADKAGIQWQSKNVAAGGLDSGAIQRSKGGVETIAIATPCRYLHSPSCVVSESDLKATVDLTSALVTSEHLFD